ncbi:MAG: hypothetical protein ACRDMH_17290 [Solirubrobacterales bacterium]
MMARSRRAVGVCLAVALALAVLPMPASAFFELDFSGHVRQDPDSFVGFNVKRTETGKRKVTFFTTRGIVYSCDDTSTGRTEFLTLEGSMRVKHRRFEGKVRVFTPQGDPVARVHGKLQGDHQVANGDLRLVGKLSPQPGLRCDTGVLEWRATAGG